MFRNERKTCAETVTKNRERKLSVKFKSTTMKKLEEYP